MDRLAAMFRETMLQKGLVPKNPWKAKKTKAWLEGLGCNFHPCYEPGYGFIRPDYAKYLNFYILCERSKVRVKGRKVVWMRIEAPHDLAEKIITLGFFPAG